MSSAVSDVAFYYPGPVWSSSEVIKNLLLFFDGVALLVPEYIRDKPERVHPQLAGPLLDKGLLHILEPEKYVDADATEKLVEPMVSIISSGALDALDRKGEFHALSMSRMGFYGDEELAKMLFDELKARGLARESEDGVSIPMHPRVRVLVLVLLSQILRGRGSELGMELLPATDRADILGGLTDLLSSPVMPSAGSVVSSDLEVVGVNLASIPLDEILDYREQHLDEHRSYAREVRRFVRELSLLDPDERTVAMDDRLEDLSHRATRLRRRSRQAWASPASLAIAGAGALWTAATSDPIGAIIGLGSAALAARDAANLAETKIDAFSYLFSLPRRMRR